MICHMLQICFCWINF